MMNIMTKHGTCESGVKESKTDSGLLAMSSGQNEGNGSC